MNHDCQCGVLRLTITCLAIRGDLDVEVEFGRYIHICTESVFEYAVDILLASEIYLPLYCTPVQ